MSHEPQVRSRWRLDVSVLPALVIYLVVAGRFAYWNRDRMSPDTIPFLQHAQYLLEGDFWKSVSGYWAPLFTWFIAPLIWLGIEKLYAARIMMYVWGAILVLTSHALAGTLARTSLRMRMISSCLVALHASSMAGWYATPDLMMAALLTWYFSLIVSPQFKSSPRRQLFAGAVAGLAFLAKSFALPFFIVHSAASIWLRWFSQDGFRSWKQGVAGWGACLLGFGLVSGPWIAVLSAKYHKPTFSTSAEINYIITGPTDVDRTHPIWRLHRPDGWEVTIWEQPELMKYAPWSPFESWAYFKHQIRTCIDRTVDVFRDFWRYDLFHLTMALFLLLPVIVWAARCNGSLRFRSLWGGTTALIYCGPFLIVYYTFRYPITGMWPMCCVYCVCLGAEVCERLSRRLKFSRLPALLGRGVIVTSFLLGTAVTYLNASKFDFWDGPNRPGGLARDVAQAMTKSGLRGPIAAYNAAYTCPWPVALYAASHTGQPYLGEARATSTADLERELAEYGVQWLVVGPVEYGTFYDTVFRDSHWKIAYTIPNGVLPVHLMTRSEAPVEKK